MRQPSSSSGLYKNVFPERIVGLDGLRGLAALLVVIFHLRSYLPISPELSSLLSSFAQGVRLFFILSGFLIGSMVFYELRDTKTFHFSSFWFRRAIRIWPLYFFMLAVSAWVYWRPLPPLLPFLTFTQNLFGDLKFYKISWTIAIEEQFYFCIPILSLLFFGFLKEAGLWVMLVLLLVTSILFRQLTGIASLHTLAMLDPLVIGMAIGLFRLQFPYFFARLLHYGWLFLSVGWLLLLFATPIISFFTLRYALHPTYYSVALALIVIATLNSGNLFARVLAIEPIAWVGRVSYGLYLSHTTILGLLFSSVDWKTATVFNAVFVALSACLLGAALLHYYIEKPAMQWRDGLAKRMWQ